MGPHSRVGTRPHLQWVELVCMGWEELTAALGDLAVYKRIDASHLLPDYLAKRSLSWYMKGSTWPQEADLCAQERLEAAAESEVRCPKQTDCSPVSARLAREALVITSACSGVWDNITCWRPANVGETVTVPCPKVFSNFYSKAGNISKNCTSDGWSETFPDFVDACGYSDPEDESKITFYILVKAIYTLGYSVSLMSLATGSIILCLFRKLHCTRNYIHLNLFLSFILRAISVLVKDDVLYSSSGTLHCPNQPSSWVGCKLSLVFLQYCIMANFFWLLVEGLYLHTLLVAVLPPGRCFLAYLLIGWGLPTVCIGAWTAARLYLEDTGCWDTNDHSVPWWVIRIPILISIIVNFVLFISIIRILLQKLTSPDVGGNDQSQYKRLAKSTLLLIPLFGVHYMVFAVFPISISSKYQILFELCLGSFQGLVVAVLYCFLNSEVSSWPPWNHVQVLSWFLKCCPAWCRGPHTRLSSVGWTHCPGPHSSLCAHQRTHNDTGKPTLLGPASKPCRPSVHPK
ncbi:vasoactive intestinal polypeptide receptor 2 isoform X1 [Macaca nemestrina]|uniref:vasoactive intestinal polypeptide receptor 2 isoform X1 n=1 Tax=Macaca nemestrina TaxID=9545 RepID=UPI0039B938D1